MHFVRLYRHYHIISTTVSEMDFTLIEVETRYIFFYKFKINKKTNGIKFPFFNNIGEKRAGH